METRLYSGRLRQRTSYAWQIGNVESLSSHGFDVIAIPLAEKQRASRRAGGEGLKEAEGGLDSTIRGATGHTNS